MLPHPMIMADFDVLCDNDDEVKKCDAVDIIGSNNYHRITTISPEEWSYADVATWLNEEGFQKYANIIAYRHKVFFVFMQIIIPTE